MKRTFHISNRVDIPEPGKPTAGGLDEAIAVAPDGYENIRFGWSGHIVADDVEDLAKTIQTTTVGSTKYITYSLREKDFDQFYNFISNGIIWAAFHYREDIAKNGFEHIVKTDKYHYGIREAIQGYYKVNKEIAAIAKKFIEPEDLVLTHDYHLIPLARHLDVDNPKALFIHTPMMNADLLETLERPQQKFFFGLFDHFKEYDMVGLQTINDVVALKSIIGDSGAPHTAGLFETEAFSKTPNSRGRITQYGAFPVAGNAPKYTEMAEQWENRPEVLSYIADNAEGEMDLMSVERRDYSKGIVPKVNGVGRWLTEFGNGNRIHLLQIAPKGREAVRAYQDESLKIETAVESINEIFGDRVKLEHEKIERGMHLGLARHSRAALITPTRDGMNLYIGEYLAAQKGRDNPGVAIVSKFAGAASIYNGSLIQVDPRQTGSIAQGIERERNLSKGERQDMLGAALEIQEFFTNDRWQISLITRTEELAQAPNPSR